MASISSLFGPSGLILLGVILSAVGAMWASTERARFEHDLRVKSDEISELNRRALQTATGGDSFCYFVIGPFSGSSAVLALDHKGEFPLYDVTAEIVDHDKMTELGTGRDKITWTELASARTIINLGNVPPGQSRVLTPDWDFGPGESKSFGVFFAARNGTITQQVELVRVDGEWVSATRVSRDPAHGEEREELLVKIHPEFPRNAEGQVDWFSR